MSPRLLARLMWCSARLIGDALVVLAFILLLAGSVSMVVSSYFYFFDDGGPLWPLILAVLVVVFVAISILRSDDFGESAEQSRGDWVKKIFLPLPAGFQWKFSRIWILGFWAFGIHWLYRFIRQADRLSSDPGLFWMSIGAGLTICGGCLIFPTVFLEAPSQDDDE